jgi:putative aldouronate transport system permease protein
MKIKLSTSRKAFIALNTTGLALLTFICLSPLIHLLAVSLSSNSYALAGRVSFWPMGFTLAAYEYLSSKPEFFRAFFVSIQRVLLGTSISMLLVILIAYPLSREKEAFSARTVYAWIFAFTMFFGGGLIPFYMVIAKLGLINTIWALVLPGAVSVWHCVMLLNFFRGVPKDLEEAARIDGAGHLVTLMYIYLPVSLPALATILLFTVVGGWNSWFDGFIFLNTPTKYPLQTYLATLVMQVSSVNVSTLTVEDLKRLENVSDKTVKVAQIFLGALPIMCVYPFLQKFFIKGIVVGSVKG